MGLSAPAARRCRCYACSTAAASTSTAPLDSHTRPPRNSRRRTRKLWPLALIAAAVLGPSAAHALFGFGDKRFKFEGLINAGQLGINTPGAQVVAWGDWNGDQFLDAITLGADRRTIEVHQWNHKGFTFEPTPAATLTLPANLAATNLVAADLNYDGRLDLLVTARSATSSASRELSLSVYLGKLDGSGFENDPIPVPSSTLAQPLSFDALGDMQLDLLGHPASGLPAAGGGSPLKVWRNLLAEANRTTADAFDIVDAPFLAPSSGSVPTCELSDPHSSAFIDLNGDCLADLFLVCGAGKDLSYQIWTATKPASKGGQSGFTLASSGSLPPGTGALSFADMDRDGTIDVVFPTCDSKGANCFINVAYNRQVPLCSLKSDGLFGNGPGANAAGQRRFSDDAPAGWDVQSRALPLTCRDPQNLCVADDAFRFDFGIRDDNADLLRIPLESLTGDSRYLTSDTLAPTGFAVPAALQLGDFDKDGHPDIALISIPDKRSTGKSNDGSGRGETRVHLLRNVACSDVAAPNRAKSGCKAGRSDARSFAAVTEGADALTVLRDVRSVSWVDIDEDGTLDLMLQRKPANSDGSDGGRRISFVQNNYFHDAFFLKSLTLNGACQSFCEPEGKPRFRPWGTNYGGASYKFTVLDPNGVRRAQQVGQLPQTTYRALLTPYSYFGLGRTNNYVESLFVGSTRRQREHHLSLEGIIPNSQVVINPWQPGNLQDEGDATTSTWTKQLYLSPGDWVPWVTVVLITTIVGLAIVVVVLHVNERREDERERKKAVHAINFDAL